MRKNKVFMGLLATSLMFSIVTEDSNQDMIEIEELLRVSNPQNFANSLEKSQLRNEASSLQLREQLLAREISLRNRMLELRRLDFLLDLPVETQIDMSNLNLSVLDERPKGFQVRDESMNFRVFEPSTYEADQLIFEERRKREESKRRQEESNNQSEMPSQPLRSESTARTTPQQNQISMPVISLDDIRGIGQQQSSRRGEQSPQNEITDAELRILGISREEYEGWISGSSGSLDPSSAEIPPQPEQEEIPEPEDYLDILAVNIGSILIFGDRRRADISIEYYFGDGITGENEIRNYKAVSQGDVINYGDYQVRISRIGRNEVEVVIVDSGKSFIGTATH